MKVIDEYQRTDLLSLRAAPKYRSYLGSLCAPYVEDHDVIEIGAGLGDFGSQLLKYSPARLTLVEPGEECFSELKQMALPGVRVLKQFSHDIARTEGAVYDTALYSNVLEHIEDDVGELGTALGVLKPGGI